MSITTFAPGEVQLKEDGSPFAFLIIGTDGVSYAADAVADLVDHVLEGHAEAASAEAKFQLRLEALIEYANEAQSHELETVRESVIAAGGADPAEVLGEPGLTALATDKGLSLDFEDFAAWPYPVALYLLTTHYSPFTQVPFPAGEHVVALDPSTERTFIDALAAMRYVTLFVNEQPLTQAEELAEI